VTYKYVTIFQSEVVQKLPKLAILV
jgi:hypothetical protein